MNANGPIAADAYVWLRSSARSDPECIDIEVTPNHMPVRSLFVCIGGAGTARLALYSVNLISPISTALRRPHDAIYTEQPLPACSTVISRQVVHDDLGGSGPIVSPSCSAPAPPMQSSESRNSFSFLPRAKTVASLRINEKRKKNTPLPSPWKSLRSSSYATFAVARPSIPRFAYPVIFYPFVRRVTTPARVYGFSTKESLKFLRVPKRRDRPARQSLSGESKGRDLVGKQLRRSFGSD